MLYNGSIDPFVLKQANSLIKTMFFVHEAPIKSNSTLLVCAHVTSRQTRSEVKEVRELAAFAEIEKFGQYNYISWLVTVPKFQGQGLATQIIQQLQETYSNLSLHEDSTNIKLKEFYQKRGFRVVPGEDRVVPNGTYEGLVQHFMIWTR